MALVSTILKCEIFTIFRSNFIKCCTNHVFTDFYEALRSTPQGCSFARNWSNSTVLWSEKKNEKPGYKIQKVITEDGVKEVKKKVFIPRITLLNPDDSMQVVDLDAAQKIAARRNLNLVKVSDMDPKSMRPTYKLLTLSEHASMMKKESTKKSADGKDEKLLNLSSKITDHDLQQKIKQILKWLEKGHTIRVSISGNPPNSSSIETISNALGDAGRIVQKIVKDGIIRFQINPPKKPKNSKQSLPKVNDSTASIEETRD